MVPVRDTRNSSRFGPGFTFLGKGAWSDSEYWNPSEDEYIRWCDVVALARARKGLWRDRVDEDEGLVRDCYLPLGELSRLRREGRGFSETERLQLLAATEDAPVGHLSQK